MRKVQTDWIKTAPGIRMDPDKAYNLQCVDVVDHYAEAIFPGKSWRETVGGVNGAKDLLANANRAYWDVFFDRPGDANWCPLPGDVLVWGGTEYGHTAVAVEGTNTHKLEVIQQNANGLANQAAHRATMPYVQGALRIIGWLRPKAAKMPADPGPAKAVAGSPAGTVVNRTVTQPVAWVRTKPDHKAPLAAGYPHGIAKGARLGVTGYVAGTDPYGTGDNAWYVTRSGLYVWANAAGNSLAGLAKR